MEKTTIKRQLHKSKLVKKPNSLLLFYIVCAVSIILVSFICFINAVGLVRVQQTSMLNTLSENQYVVILNRPRAIRRGNIVVVTDPESNLENPPLLIKRVAATGGDTVRFIMDENNYTVHLYLKRQNESNFTRQNEKYIKEAMVLNHNIFANLCLMNREVIYEVPHGNIFVMGDNRNVSRDSRLFGSVSVSSARGLMMHRLRSGSILEWFFRLLYPDRGR